MHAVSAVWHTQRAKKLICLRATISDELVVLLDLWLTTHTFELKRSHCCLICPSKACQGARNAVVTSKINDAVMKHFQQKPRDKNLENTMKNPMIPCFRRKIEVGSRFRGNRQIDRRKDRHTDRMSTVTLQAYVHQGLITKKFQYPVATPSDSTIQDVFFKTPYRKCRFISTPRN